MSEWFDRVRATGGPRARLAKSGAARVSSEALRTINYKKWNWWNVPLSKRGDRAQFRSEIRDLPVTTFAEWQSIPLPPGLREPEHLRITDMVVERTPNQVDEAFRTYKYKTEFLLEKYGEGANYKVVVAAENDASGFEPDAYAEVICGDEPRVVLYKSKMKMLSEINVFLAVMHEIAHVLDKSDELFKIAHSDRWKKICLKIGGDGNRYGDQEEANVGYAFHEDVRDMLVFRCDADETPCVAGRMYGYRLGEDRTTEFIKNHVNRNNGRLDGLAFPCPAHGKDGVEYASLVHPPPFKSAGEYADFLFETYVTHDD
jgi:hypothetical protein